MPPVIKYERVCHVASATRGLLTQHYSAWSLGAIMQEQIKNK